MHIESYTEPVVIRAGQDFSRDPKERAVVIVRGGYGATGLKDAWSKKELDQGRTPYRVGRFDKEESKMLDADRTLAFLPARVSGI